MHFGTPWVGSLGCCRLLIGPVVLISKFGLAFCINLYPYPTVGGHGSPIFQLSEN